MSTPSESLGRAAHLDVSQVTTPRMVFVILGLWICLFLSALETTIVSTALRSIANDLDDSAESTWIVVAYLLTYNGFLLLYSKLTDIFGQKSLLILAESIFAISSIACGVAQTMTQLIVFRALQGIGGSGIYSTVFVIVTKIGTIQQIPIYLGIMTSVFALASLLGPILGGVIVDNTTWRWVFFINGPGITVSLLFIILAVPNLDGKLIDKEMLYRVDVVGGALSLAWPILLVFALEQGGVVYAWNSGPIIGTLVGSALGLLTFGFYEIWVHQQGKREPIFPVHLLKSPMLCLNLLIMFTMGGCFYAAIILLPQRFQSVDSISASRAGVALLPFTLVSPFFSMACGGLLPKVSKISTAVLICSSIATVVGIALLATLSETSLSITPSVYGYEIILAFGLGSMMPPILLFIKVEYDDTDLAAVMGATNTARTLGGCVALAVSSTISHGDLATYLRTFLSPPQVEGLLSSTESVSTLSPGDARKVQLGYGRSYNRQFEALIAFAGANMVATLILGLLRWFQRRQRT